MIDTIGLLKNALTDDAKQAILDFIFSQQNSNGGFRGRAADSDLYYTQFALQCLEGLGITSPPPLVRSYLESFNNGSELDLVHTTCLARCWASPLIQTSGETPTQILKRIDAHYIKNNGYRLDLEDESDSIYATFLAVLAHQDWVTQPCRLDGFFDTLSEKRSTDEGYADQSGLDSGTTPVTAAVAMLLADQKNHPFSEIVSWLISQWFPAGGFLATPNAPIPDLLSTATALFALKTLGADITPFHDKTMKFIEYVWDENGGFCGHIADTVADCEYTFYGLITLGLLTDGS